MPNTHDNPPNIYSTVWYPCQLPMVYYFKLRNSIVWYPYELLLINHQTSTLYSGLIPATPGEPYLPCRLVPIPTTPGEPPQLPYRLVHIQTTHGEAPNIFLIVRY